MAQQMGLSDTFAGAILVAITQSLAGLGIIVTCAYLWGMLERKDKTFLGMGIASAIVLFV
jgi:hypothetical protein